MIYREFKITNAGMRRLKDRNLYKIQFLLEREKERGFSKSEFEKKRKDLLVIRGDGGEREKLELEHLKRNKKSST